MTAASFERIGKACRSFWLYLQRSGARTLLDADPFAGPFKLARGSAKKTKTGRSGTSYTPEEVSRLYAAALSSKDSNPDSNLAYLIALGAYTGARIEELCSLKVQHCTGGQFTITDAKTDAGIRQVPIHSAIVALVASMTEASTDGYLVPSTAAGKYGVRSDALSKRFGRLKGSLGFGRGHVFHSIRKTVATQLEQAGVAEGVAADILGHEKKTLSYGLYSSGTSAKQKSEALAKLAYPSPLNTI